MRPKPWLALVLGCLFVSGAAGLIYEIVWARYLALFLGHTSYAVVAVLTAFMAGLAIGNAWLGRIADRVAKPLLFYAWLELGIVAYAFLFPFYYDLCHGAYVHLARAAQLHDGGLLVLKFLFSFLTILVPTILMGGTLPALTRFITRSLGELQQSVGSLYFINSAGAVTGCLLADFWTIPQLGLEASVLIGGLLNFAAAVTALAISYFSTERTLGASAPAGDAVTPSGSVAFSAGQINLAILAIGLSGFVAMLYEVAWTRMLALALGSSTHAFSLMLITFIAGIAAGAWIVSAWNVTGRALLAFGWAEVALAVTVGLSMFYYDLLPYWFATLASLLNRRPEAYPLYQLLQGLICFGVMFVPTLCLGTTVPLASRIATRELGQAGRRVGVVFAINTLGTVLGAAVTGLIFLPSLGLARTFGLGVGLNLLIGLALLGQGNGFGAQGSAGSSRSRLAWGWLTAALLGIFLLSGWLFDSTWRSAFSWGLWRYRDLPPTQANFRQSAANQNFKYYRDGAGSTVTVTSWMSGTNEQMALKVNGKVEGSSGGLDVSTQLLLGHIPLLLHPGPKKVLIIGLGTGMTCGAATVHPSVTQIDTVEISSEVVEAAKLFAAHNDRIFNDPRFRLIIEDAKSYLQITPNQYDVIISEPSNPWMAGVAGVFTQEYYESCRDRLEKGGLMVQWVQIYETSEEAFQVVLGTFASVFPQVAIWQGGQSDLILIGTTQPFQPDLEQIKKRFQEPKVKASLARFDLTRLPILLSRELIPAANAPYILPETSARHSDFFPVLEFVAQRAFFTRSEATSWQRYDENLSPRPATLLGQLLQSAPLNEGDLKAFASFFLTTKMPYPRLFQTLLHRWKEINPQSILPLELESQMTEHRTFSEIEVVSMAAQRGLVERAAEKDPDLLRRYEALLLAVYRTQRSAFHLPGTNELDQVIRRLLQTDARNQRVYHCHLAELAWDHGNDEGCIEQARLAFDPDLSNGPVTFQTDPAAPGLVLARMMESYWRQGQLRRAWELREDAAKNGYLRAGASHPLLEMVSRKIEAAVGTSGRP